MSEAGWIVDQLVQQGVTKFCIAPGSRSTPLVLAAAKHPKAETMIHFDERGLAFYALGYAKSTKRPAAVITTSGTAIGNLMPAAMEASHSHTPMILLTADRPHELRDCGANQSSDQVKHFANAIRWQMDIAPNLDEKTIRSIAAQCFFHSLQNSPGPVHLNCPFREPFDLDPSIEQGKSIDIFFPKQITEPVKTTASRGIILIGRVDDPAPILKLAKRLRWPVFADLLSNARCTSTPEQILHYDYLIRSPLELQPDLMIHFGERLTCKHILEWAKETPLMHVSSRPQLQDPSRRISARIQSDIDPFCETFQADTSVDWLKNWQEKDQEINLIIEENFQLPFTEAHIYRSLPQGCHLFLGNGLPIRDCDHFFFPKHGCTFFANRGLSGIDGNIATAVGISDGLKKPLIAIIGDQTALYDLNSFSLLKNRPILLIISNNFGGGIFEHLPISRSSFFETYFAATHSWNFEAAAKMFDIPYIHCLETTPDPWPTSGIVEIVTDRKKSYLFQKQLLESCSLSTSRKKFTTENTEALRAEKKKGASRIRKITTESTENTEALRAEKK